MSQHVFRSLGNPRTGHHRRQAYADTAVAVKTASERALWRKLYFTHTKKRTTNWVDMLREWNAAVEQQNQLPGLVAVTNKTQFHLKQHEAEEIRAFRERTHPSAFVDYVNLDMQVAGAVPGMGCTLTTAEVQMYAAHVQQLAQRQEAQAMTQPLPDQQAANMQWGEGDSSMAAVVGDSAAAAAGVAGGGWQPADFAAATGDYTAAAAAAAAAEVEWAGTPGGVESEAAAEQQAASRRSRGSISAPALLGKRPRAAHSDHKCSQCGLVIKANGGRSRHPGAKGFAQGMYCPYSCSICNLPMAQHTSMCRHGR
jgi:hypothetical protein